MGRIIIHTDRKPYATKGMVTGVYLDGKRIDVKPEEERLPQPVWFNGAAKKKEDDHVTD